MFMRVVRGMQDQLNHHKDLIPLMASYAGAGLLSIAAIAYTSLAKEDVVYNRWWNPVPSVHIDPSKAQQRLVVIKDNKEVYARDPLAETLRKEVYAGGAYYQHPSKSSHH